MLNLLSLCLEIGKNATRLPVDASNTERDSPDAKKTRDIFTPVLEEKSIFD